MPPQVLESLFQLSDLVVGHGTLSVFEGLSWKGGLG